QHVERGQPQSDPQRRRERQQRERHDADPARLRRDSVRDQEYQQQHEREHEVERSRQHGSKRNGEPREVHLRDEILAEHHAVGRLREPIGEERPRYERGEREQWVRHPLRRHLRQSSEEEAEHEHREERLEDRPRDAEQRLLVAHLHVAPREEVDQLPLRPQLAQREARPPRRRLDDHYPRLRLAHRARPAPARRSSQRSTALSSITRRSDQEWSVSACMVDTRVPPSRLIVATSESACGASPSSDVSTSSGMRTRPGAAALRRRRPAPARMSSANVSAVPPASDSMFLAIVFTASARVDIPSSPMSAAEISTAPRSRVSREAVTAATHP